MSNLRIAYVNRADTATLTANPVVESTMPVTYLQNDSRGYVMRSTSTTAQEIKGEWGGTGYTLGCCSLYRHNLITNDTWRLQLYSDTTWTTSVYDSGTIDAFSDNTFDDWDFEFSVMWFTAVSGVKSFKLTITSSTNPDGYVEASRLFLGAYTEAEYNPKYGMSLGYESSANVVRSDGGSLYGGAKSRWRTLSFDIEITSESQRATWAEIGRFCGIDKTVLVSVYPGNATAALERDYTLLGKFEKSPEQVASSFNLFDHSIKLLEI
jgi:hypothetical protein